MPLPRPPARLPVRPRRPTDYDLRVLEKRGELKAVHVARALRIYSKLPAFRHGDDQMTLEAERIVARFCAVGADYLDGLSNLNRLDPRTSDLIPVMDAIGYRQGGIEVQFGHRLVLNVIRDAAARAGHASRWSTPFGPATGLVLRSPASPAPS